MPKRSAGLLLYRGADPASCQVLLVHPGGPFWARRDLGAWTVPKGEYGPEEDPLAAAEREFAEETGIAAPGGPRHDLGELRQRGGKLTRLWAVAGDLDVALVRSNSFTMQWPPRSGETAEFPEVDRAGWFVLAEARQRLLASLEPFLDRLVTVLGGDVPPRGHGG
ncbi:MAG TPA: NUDIX domain-containing protein [Acidimicrobiales bacterium]|nr:NUDIX domain-containing protein [Acidimicrobiales bacterium]